MGKQKQTLRNGLKVKMGPSQKKSMQQYFSELSHAINISMGKKILSGKLVELIEFHKNNFVPKSYYERTVVSRTRLQEEFLNYKKEVKKMRDSFKYLKRLKIL